MNENCILFIYNIIILKSLAIVKIVIIIIISVVVVVVVINAFHTKLFVSTVV